MLNNQTVSARGISNRDTRLAVGVCATSSNLETFADARLMEPNFQSTNRIN